METVVRLGWLAKSGRLDVVVQCLSQRQILMIPTYRGAIQERMAGQQIQTIHLVLSNQCHRFSPLFTFVD